MPKFPGNKGKTTSKKSLCRPLPEGHPGDRDNFFCRKVLCLLLPWVLVGIQVSAFGYGVRFFLLGCHCHLPMRHDLVYISGSCPQTCFNRSNTRAGQPPRDQTRKSVSFCNDKVDNDESFPCFHWERHPGDFVQTAYVLTSNFGCAERLPTLISHLSLTVQRRINSEWPGVALNFRSQGTCLKDAPECTKIGHCHSLAIFHCRLWHRREFRISREEIWGGMPTILGVNFGCELFGWGLKLWKNKAEKLAEIFCWKKNVGNSPKNCQTRIESSPKSLCRTSGSTSGASLDCDLRGAVTIATAAPETCAILVHPGMHRARPEYLLNQTFPLRFSLAITLP